MKDASAAAVRVRVAQAELAAAERELARSARPWQLRLQRHRNALVLCGGFVSGLALTFLPTRWWARFGAGVGATAAVAARSTLTPALIGALLAKVRRSSDGVNGNYAQPGADG
jgi:hypothetical protein